MCCFHRYLEQEPQLTDGATVGDNLESAVAETRQLLQAYTDATLEMSQEGADFDKIGDKVEKLQSEIEARDGWELDRMLERAMDALRCPPLDANVDTLSGGERRRVALCKLLLKKPSLLLLGKPESLLLAVLQHADTVISCMCAAATSMAVVANTSTANAYAIAIAIAIATAVVQQHVCYSYYRDCCC
jgi:ABC-type sugar transport system ATPase subunit